MCCLIKAVEEKNEQLDTVANRKILLIGNNFFFAEKEYFSEAISKIVSSGSVSFHNIDELFVEFKFNDFARVYNKTT